MKKKDYEKAQEMINLIPEREADKNTMRARLYLEQDKINDAAVVLERQLINGLNEVLSILASLMDIAVRENKLEVAEKIASAGEQTALLYGLWGYSPLILPMELSFRKKDVEGSIGYIRQLLRRLTGPQNVSKSVFFRHIYSQTQGGKNIDRALESYSNEVLPALVESFKTNEECAFLRGNEEFEKLLEEYGTPKEHKKDK